ncbi:MAG: methylmalonyl-CoA mutase family protein [Bacteroidales bacterium]|jgi:methylmalonyl-CoA mutase|nr:methylmalonyl-CoA mutase family protein [Bacteroidales bacterium]
MAEKYNKLFEEFPPVSAEAWRNKVIADLKGADFDRKLVWRTNEGFPVQPYYRQEDLARIDYLDVLPNEFPFVRGTKTRDNDWLVRQDIDVTDLEAANRKALDVLMKGVTSLGFIMQESREWTVADINTLLKDIALQAVELNFVSKCYNRQLVDALLAFIESGGYEPQSLKISIGYDPLSGYLLRGRFHKGLDYSVETAKYLVERTADFSNFRVLTVNGKNFGNAGATVVQELAFALAQGAEYISLLDEAGVAVNEIARKIKFNLSIGADYFMQIAGFRAARLLWAELVDAWKPVSKCGCKCAGKMCVNAETSKWNMAFYDPYVNLLRTQTEAMSAALGGVSSITVLPFNAVYETPTEFSERIARNQQLLLKEESHFDKIVDPAAGSYYIEELTALVADETWKLFLQIQEKGGFIAAAKEGFIQTLVKTSGDKRCNDVATRRENMLGVNQFPNFTEHYDVDKYCPSVFEPKDLTDKAAEIETITQRRGAQAFEKLRAATDRAAKTGKRPLAFMLTIGDQTMRMARAQFSCNFFAVAGFSVQDNNGFATVEEGVAAARKAGADIIVLCSSDDEYATLAPATFALTKDKIFVVAGAPACTDDLKAQGITNFIHVKSNLLDELQRYQYLLLK